MVELPELPTAPTEPQLPPVHHESEVVHISFGDRVRQTVAGYKNWAELHPYAATTVETVALFAAKKAVRSAGDMLGLNLGNGHTDAQLDVAANHPVLAAAHSIIAAPIFEETVFRGILPGIVKSRLGVEAGTRASRIIDQIAVLGFAATHIGNPVTKRGRDSLAIPLSPLMGGEQYQSLARRKGIGHAVIAHMVHNTLASAEVVPKMMKMRRSKLGKMKPD